jgi:CRP-like cAMP-binding protein
MTNLHNLIRPLAERIPQPTILDLGFGGIGRNRLLAGLPPADFDLLAPHITETALDKGAVLQEAGELITRVYFPHSGLISLLGMLPEGHAVDTASIGREGAVGLMVGLGGHTALSQAVVHLPVRAAQIPAARFIEAAAQSRAIRDMIVRYSDVLLAQVQQLLACNTVHHVQERLCRWLLNARDRIGGDTLPLTQEFLADVLGVQRTTVTMIGRTLQAQGIIHVRRGRIHIRDLMALERKACACYRLGRRLTDQLGRANGG